MTLNGEQLPRSQMVKCLGVWIDDGLTQKRQAEAACEEELLPWMC